MVCYRIASRALVWLSAASALSRSVPAAESACEVYVEKDSMIVFEAEGFAQNDGYDIVDDPTASGGKYVQSTSKGKGVHYYIDVKTVGRWNVYMRFFNKTHMDNGLFLQVDGKDIYSDKGHNIIRLDSGRWKWHMEWQCGEGCHYWGVYVDLEPGWHKFSIRKRETGCRSDKFCLAVKGKEVKGLEDRTGMGPAISPCASTEAMTHEGAVKPAGTPSNYPSLRLASPSSMPIRAWQLDGRRVPAAAGDPRNQTSVVVVDGDYVSGPRE